MGYNRVPSTLRLLHHTECPVEACGQFSGALTLPPNPDRIKEGGLRLQGKYKKGTSQRPLISIITPVRNGKESLRETIESVLEQNYDNVEYIVVDGASTDGSVSVLDEYSHYLDYWVSEPDHGMYDALRKGLTLARGDVVAYLNAGDYYHRCALSVVAKIMVDYPETLWLTGMNVNYNADSEVMNVVTPNVYYRSLIRSGWYGPILPFIQQESTFWRRELLGIVDPVKLAGLKYAGDYYLWYCFSSRCDLAVVNAYLGGFKTHPGQLSSDINAYFTETSALSDKKKPWQFILCILAKVLWYCPVFVKKLLGRRRFFVYDLEKMRWVN